MIKVKAKVDKSSISDLANLKGSVNCETVEIGGEKFDPSSVCFMGFSGRADGDTQIYVGEYNFRRVNEGDETSGSVAHFKDEILSLNLLSHEHDMTDAAERLAGEHDINSGEIEGTGQNGKIVKADVLERVGK